MLHTLYSNFAADVDNALLFLIEKDTSSQDKDEKIIFVILFTDETWLCPRRAQSREFFSGLPSNLEIIGLNKIGSILTSVSLALLYLLLTVLTYF